MYIPEGFGTVFPYIFVLDGSSYLAFLTSAFSAEVLGVTETADGGVANARVRIGTTSFMVSETGGRMPPSQAAFYIYVEDADQVQVQALANGAREIMAPMDMPYGDRQGGIYDPEGNTWWISTRNLELPYD